MGNNKQMKTIRWETQLFRIKSLIIHQNLGLGTWGAAGFNWDSPRGQIRWEKSHIYYTKPKLSLLEWEFPWAGRYPMGMSVYFWNSHIFFFAFFPGFASAASHPSSGLDLGCAAPRGSHPSSSHLPELWINRNSPDPEFARLPNSLKRISGNGHIHAQAAPRTLQSPPEATPHFQRHSHSISIPWNIP